MLGIHAALLTLTMGLIGPADRLEIVPEEFRGWFEAAERNELRVPKAVASRASGFRYVFISGFRAEGLRGDFAQNAEELRRLGVPKRAMHFIRPSSHKTVDENAESVATEFLKAAEAGPERLVVVAHSRGACDALSFALQHPDFVRDRVEVMFLLQGPFGGTGLADYVMGDGPPVDGRMRRVPRVLARMIGGFESVLMSYGRHGGITGMTHDASRSYWNNIIEANPESITSVGPKTYYIEAETKPSRLRLFLRATAGYLGAHYGPNDGVVARGDQSLPGLGTSLGVLDAGHPDLTRGFPASRAGKRTRKALMRGIVMAVGRSEG